MAQKHPKYLRSSLWWGRNPTYYFSYFSLDLLLLEGIVCRYLNDHFPISPIKISMSIGMDSGLFLLPWQLLVMATLFPRPLEVCLLESVSVFGACFWYRFSQLLWPIFSSLKLLSLKPTSYYKNCITKSNCKKKLWQLFRQFTGIIWWRGKPSSIQMNISIPNCCLQPGSSENKLTSSKRLLSRFCLLMKEIQS